MTIRIPYSIRLFRILTAVIILCAGCAKVVTPVGGPKDTTPPKMVKESPPSQNVRFHDAQIRITFDEYFTLNNPGENVLISPPLKHQPDYSIHNKTLVIKFKDTLRPNTTYNMVFSNCIQDFHEGNKLSFYPYSFSTGDALDSFQLKGKILKANTLGSASDFFVLLYRGDSDTLPLTSLPDYVTKSQSDGSFMFSNITGGNYQIFALKDINTNMLYDLPNEEMAFCDHTVQAYTTLRKDSTMKDSSTTSDPLILYAFTAADTIPLMLHPENPVAGIYKFPYKSSFNLLDIQPLSREIEFFQTINPTRDTVIWYTKQPMTDTLSFVFSADGHADTVVLKPYKSKATGRSSKSSIQRISVGVQNAGHYFLPPTLSFNYPIRPVDSFPVFIMSAHDTVLYRFHVPDTFVMTLPIQIPLEARKNYTLMIPDSVFFGYNNLTNDTLVSRFTMKSEKDYGNLILHYILPDNGHPYICQLMSDKRILRQNILQSSGIINYEHLNPGNYNIRVIEDRNHNGIWDAGNYHRHLQPERVFLFSKNINIRAYWDVEETFNVGTQAKTDNSN